MEKREREEKGTNDVEDGNNKSNKCLLQVAPFADQSVAV